MSWDCDICGKGYESDHSECRRTQEISSSLESVSKELSETNELLKELLQLLKKKVTTE